MPKAVSIKRKKEIDSWIVVLPQAILITQIQEVDAEEGKPNCRLIEPFVITEEINYTLSPYLISYTCDNSFMIHSDKIITIAKPNVALKVKYDNIINE